MVGGVRRRDRALGNKSRYDYRRIRYRGRGPALPRPSRLGWVVYGVGTLLFGLGLMFGKGGILHGRELEVKLEQTAAGNRTLTSRLTRLNQEARFYKDDPFGVEKMSRERYGMAKPDELIFYFEDDGVLPPVPLDGLNEDGRPGERGIRVDSAGGP
jgi:cell division protein FtsB